MLNYITTKIKQLYLLLGDFIAISLIIVPQQFMSIISFRFLYNAFGLTKSSILTRTLCISSVISYVSINMLSIKANMPENIESLDLELIDVLFLAFLFVTIYKLFIDEFNNKCQITTYFHKLFIKNSSGFYRGYLDNPNTSTHNFPDSIILFTNICIQFRLTKNILFKKDFNKAFACLIFLRIHDHSLFEKKLIEYSNLNQYINQEMINLEFWVEQFNISLDQHEPHNKSRKNQNYKKVI